MRSKTLNVAFLVLLGMMLATLFILMQKPWQAGASFGPDTYNSTTTPNLVGNQMLLKTGFGTLGSVIVTGPRVGNFQLVNATTSDATKRAIAATSTLLIADFPQTTVGNATSTGTHTYDVSFTDGLLFVGAGSVSTTTITWK